MLFYMIAISIILTVSIILLGVRPEWYLQVLAVIVAGILSGPLEFVFFNPKSLLA